MSDIITTYQEEKDIESKEPEAASFATVGAVYSDGLSLIFGSDGTASEKHYKCNMGVKFAAGNRVKVTKDRGTYVVEYVVGNPITALVADSASSATTATSAKSATSATSATSAATAANFTGKHTGSSLSFFNDGSKYSKQEVPRASASGTLAQTITTLNKLIDALKKYNLIQ